MELIIAKAENGLYQVQQRYRRRNFFGCEIEETFNIGAPHSSFSAALEILKTWVSINEYA